MVQDLGANLLSATVFALLGLIVLLLAFVAVDRMTPYALWREIIEKHNMALAILVGALGLGISIIIAAAIH